MGQDAPEEGVAEPGHKSMIEAWAEEHEDHEVFKPGVRIRVGYESLLHKLRYGLVGRVVGHRGGEVCCSLEGMLAPVVLSESLLVNIEGQPKPKPLKTFLRECQETKKNLLRVIGIQNPCEDGIEVTTLQQQDLSDVEVDYFCHVSRWSLGLNEVRQVQLAPVTLTSMLLEGHLQKAQSAGAIGMADPEAHVRRLRVFRHMFEVSELMVMPVRGLNPEHFTLLAVSKKQDEEVRVRYYDSLLRTHENCLENARSLLSILQVKPQIQDAFNQSFQTELDCGFLHAITWRMSSEALAMVEVRCHGQIRGGSGRLRHTSVRLLPVLRRRG